jgi:hypothetical protein
MESSSLLPVLWVLISAFRYFVICGGAKFWIPLFVADT